MTLEENQGIFFIGFYAWRTNPKRKSDEKDLLDSILSYEK